MLYAPFQQRSNAFAEGEAMKSAKGLRGILLTVGLNDRVVFRVYEAGGGFFGAPTFTDYDIVHPDMAVIIDDDDAFLYNKDGEHYIDMSPQSLGLDEEKKKE
jgi:hypothetical protein